MLKVNLFCFFVLAVVSLFAYDVNKRRNDLILRIQAQREEAELLFRQSRCDRSPLLLKAECERWSQLRYPEYPGWLQALSSSAGSIVSAFLNELHVDNIFLRFALLSLLIFLAWKTVLSGKRRKKKSRPKQPRVRRRRLLSPW
eukprot:Gregarina_sp_Poly_1__9656@NODE_611_length_7145_cov_95_802063_g467_i0_p6_GENE_NODE_611_length_7145_cov_95_802063_g467_i0NODE_611_length_7145_cov_95_802063_g467_i0_p6_ORF_typecomplete_len143_score17_38Brr6_like_C_C/PF10104_9/2_2e08TauE/PF01925_19/0_0014_NODE_611_length_7145_cov_95_802063_g467_i049785406